MRRYSTTRKRIWIPFVSVVITVAIVVFIIYKEIYLSATVLIIPLFFLPSILRSRRGDPDLVIIDTKLVKRGIPINKEFELSEYYEFKIEKSILNIKGIYGYKIVDEIKKRDLLVRGIYQDSLETILKKFYHGII
jgi:hypothetical protein